MRNRRSCCLCFTCVGRGKIMCVNCSGQGRLLTFLQMKVKWENHSSEFVANDNSEFPSEKFEKVSGNTIFIDEDTTVQPVTTFSDPSIIEASQNILEDHAMLSNDYKILRQRQNIELLPLSKVYYTWKGKQGVYYVYGMENKTYCDNYPRKCCCCVIM
ncbi:protein SSUH2 homolog isoform X2 [Dendropsophus ebraccatus]|uniref:protein SSUH2 homolog isoform X2 n=1 Tax=Dendropsophus ebraccatus TaxID=150705 RepID=UPI00383121D5